MNARVTESVLRSDGPRNLESWREGCNAGTTCSTGEMDSCGDCCDNIDIKISPNYRFYSEGEEGGERGGGGGWKEGGQIVTNDSYCIPGGVNEADLLGFTPPPCIESYDSAEYTCPHGYGYNYTYCPACTTSYPGVIQTIYAPQGPGFRMGSVTLLNQTTKMETKPVQQEFCFSKQCLCYVIPGILMLAIMIAVPATVVMLFK